MTQEKRNQQVGPPQRWSAIENMNDKELTSQRSVCNDNKLKCVRDDDKLKCVRDDNKLKHVRDDNKLQQLGMKAREPP
jgi:hypothetical protein